MIDLAQFFVGIFLIAIAGGIACKLLGIKSKPKQEDNETELPR